MIDRIRKEVNRIFHGKPHTKKIQELKEELIGNLEAKYKDLIEVGKTPEEAYNIVIASIGDIDELIDSMAPIDPFKSKDKESRYKKKVKKVELYLWLFVVIILGGSLIYVISNGLIQTQKKQVIGSTNDRATNGGVYSNHRNQPTKEMEIPMSVPDTGTWEMEVAKEETIQIDETDFINMELISADVEVSFIEGNEMKVVEYTKDKDKNELFELTQSGNTINVIREEDYRFFSLGNRSYHKVEVFIPINFKEKLAIETSAGNITLLSNTYIQELEVSTTSGTFVCKEEIQVSKADISSASGDKQINKLKTMSYSMYTTSGDTRINSLEGNGSIESSSGYVRIGKINGENHNITSSSGDIEIEEGKGNFTVTSSSGNKNLGDLVGGIHHIISASGDIDIEKLQGDGNIETTSGRVKINEIIQGKMDVKTSSGNVAIEALEGYGRISTMSGEISVALIKLQGDAVLNTSSGTVSISAHQQVNAAIEIETSSGDIEGNIEASYKTKNGNEATAQFGNGKENTIKIATTSGDIVLTQN